MTCAACGADLTGEAWMVGIATLEGKMFCSLRCAKVDFPDRAEVVRAAAALAPHRRK